MFRLESPQYLVSHWFILIFVLLGFFLIKKSNNKIKTVFGVRSAQYLTASVSNKKRYVKLLLQSLVLAFMTVGLARPQFGQSKHEVKSEGVELVMVADVSESMLSEDIRPSRLEFAKADMMKLVEMLSGNKIGLVAFAGNAVSLSPMTTDPSALKLFIDSLAINSVSTQGTSLRLAIEEAVATLRHGSQSDDKKSTATQVILFLSDGEDHEPGALELAKKVANNGIRIFTIAYGTQKGAPIPEKDSLGYLKGYKKDKDGNTVLSKVNGDALQSLAQAGSGGFYFASPGGTYLKTLKEDIDKLEKAEFETQLAVDYDEKFQLVLILAFIAACIEMILGDRQAKGQTWKGRFSTTSSILIFLGLFLMTPKNTFAESLIEAVELNKKGVQELKKQNFMQAQNYFSKAVGEAPYMPELQFNLGLSFDQMGQPEKAKKFYEVVEPLVEKPETKFAVEFNLAELAGREKNVDLALAHYQKALAIQQDSIEAKTNIEMLIQQQQQDSKSGKDDKNKDNQKNENQDKKDQNKQDQKDKNQKDDKDQKDNKDQKNKQDQQEKDPHHQKSKPQPRPFKSENLSPGDVKKILDEMDRQEQKVRAEFNKKQSKEKSRDKDW